MSSLFAAEPPTAPARPTVPTTPPAPPQPPKWVSGATIPSDATEAGKSGGKPLYICRMAVPSKEEHVGKGWNGNCYVEFGGKELKNPLAQAQVLAMGANVGWAEVSDGKVPPIAIPVGISGGVPMHVCRAKVPNGEVHPGKSWKGNCYVGFGGKGIKTDKYEVMTVAH